MKMDKTEADFQVKVSEKQLSLFQRSQILAAIIIFASLGCGTWIALAVSPKAGSTIVCTTLATVAGAFFWSKWRGSNSN